MIPLPKIGAHDRILHVVVILFSCGILPMFYQLRKILIMSGFSFFGLLRSTVLPLLSAALWVVPVSVTVAQTDTVGVVDAGEILIENVTPDAVPDTGELASPDAVIDNAAEVGKPIDAIVEGAVSDDVDAAASAQEDSAPSSATLSDDGTVSISAPTAYGDSRKSIDGADDFFDAENLVPQGEMAKKGPVKVNPLMQPASKLVTVTKDYEQDTKTAKIVSAERAMSLGMYDSALTMFEGLAVDYPREPRVLMGKAVSLQKLGRFDEAMQTYDVLTKMDSKNVNVKVNMLGLLATRYPAVALRQLLDLHSEHSDNVGLTAQVAIAYAQSGDMTSSMKYFGIASSMEPKNAGHIYNMAIMADRSGESKDAVKYYEQALEIDAMYGSGRTVPRDAIYERLAKLR